MKKIFLLVCLLALVTGCSTARVRTKFTDPAHRVFIVPSGINEDAYVRLQTSLVESNKFFVVDRARGFDAVKEEQDMIHRNDVDRFDDEEKYAMYGKLYSVGAVITANERCHWEQGIFSYTMVCLQNMAAIDTITGQVITAASNVSRSSDATNSWDDTVDKFNASFPKTWESEKYDEKMMHFRKVAAENALRAKEKLAREKE